MNNHLDTVQEASRQLGPMRTSDAREIEENKARLARRAAYLINQRDPEIGLFKKTGGNNVLGLSVDLLVDRAGNKADIATDVDDGDGARRVEALWIESAADDNTRDAFARQLWVQPTAELAGVEPGQEPGTDPGGDDPAVPPADLTPVLAEIAVVREQLQRIEEKVGAPVAPVASIPPEYESQRILGIGTIRLKPITAKAALMARSVRAAAAAPAEDAAVPPLVSAAVGSILRKALTLAGAWMIANGVPWTDSELAEYVIAAVPILVSLGWSLWKNHRERIKFLIGLYAPPGATEGDVNLAARAGVAP